MTIVAPLEVGVCCSSSDRLVQFYTDVLGALLISTAEVSAELADKAGVGASGYKVARVELPTGERLKFLEPSVPPQDPPETGAILDRRNTNYLTFIVGDLTETADRARLAGATFLNKTGPIEIRSGVYILLATDPEGNLIEFVSYDDLSGYRPELA